MREYNGEILLTISEVCARVKKSQSTIGNWYRAEQYYKNNGKSLPLPLPPYINNIDSKHTRYWKETDIPKLIYFGENIPRGALADYNRLCWGDAGGIERGERVKARRLIQEMLNEGRFQNE